MFLVGVPSLRVTAPGAVISLISRSRSIGILLHRHKQTISTETSKLACYNYEHEPRFNGETLSVN